MERITATFDRATAAAIRKVAGKRGVSAFLQQAARERLARLQVLQLLDELDAEYGAPSAAEADAVAREASAVFGPLERKSKGKPRRAPRRPGRR